MDKKELLNFLNEYQQKRIENHELYQSGKIKLKSDIKIIYKYNYSFHEGGLVVGFNYPILEYLEYQSRKKYSINLKECYVFYKESLRKTKREFFEDLLKNLEKKVKKSKI